MKKQKTARRSGVSRRDFFKSAGTGLLASEFASAAPGESAADPGASSVHFTPRSRLTQISPNLCVLRDTCNVYVLKDGNRALLIDFGSGHVLNLLSQIGVTKVDAILHTHHHRDQCQGDARAVAERIPIHAPAHERHLFEDAENFWRNRRVFHLYYVANDFFTITADSGARRSRFRNQFADRAIRKSAKTSVRACVSRAGKERVDIEPCR